MTDDDVDLSTFPWKKVTRYGGQLLASAAIALGGYVMTAHLGDEPDGAPSEQQQQLMLRHWNWRVECKPFAASGELGFEARLCESDASILVRVQRGPSVVSFFILAPTEAPPVIVGDLPASLLELVDPPVYAQQPCLSAGCLYAGDHGAPDADPPVRYGDPRPDGWVPAWFYWRDGCVLERYFHAASGAWSTQQCWIRCAGHGR